MTTLDDEELDARLDFWRVDIPRAFRDEYPEAYAEVREGLRAGRIAFSDDPSCVRVAGPPDGKSEEADFEHIIVLHDEEPETAPSTQRRQRRPRDPDTLTFTVEEAGQKLGISRALAYEAVRTGQIPSIHIGKRILVPKAALARLLEAS